MTNYEELPLSAFADAARASNPELGALGASLVNYFTGAIIANFDDAETALFLASAREIVLELVRRLQECERER